MKSCPPQFYNRGGQCTVMEGLILISPSPVVLMANDDDHDVTYSLRCLPQLP